MTISARPPKGYIVFILKDDFIAGRSCLATCTIHGAISCNLKAGGAPLLGLQAEEWSRKCQQRRIPAIPRFRFLQTRSVHLVTASNTTCTTNPRETVHQSLLTSMMAIDRHWR